ncbi:cytochrome C oxidase subunit IV family protein [Aquimarina sediminis]|uniref:cytochrome C oxidase subunit IV family protein n=1 Tax=Aquimarina sediminis TaxID=2070536 RepID=UPI000CA014BC|nr:cytochrome C oxidase subunit IV family protein [Aquimarina sediminis]
MKNHIIITYILLIVLTIISGLISGVEDNGIPFVILLLSVLKFIGVSFYFMDLKKAHIFWKSAIFCYLSVLVIVVLII